MVALWAVNATGCTGNLLPRVGPERQATSWSTYLGSPRHDAAAAETLNPDPRPLWRTEVGRVIRGSPAIGESVIAVGLGERYVVLLDRTTGQVIWRTRLHGTIQGGPLLDEDRLYAATQTTPEGRVYALRLKNGDIIWKTRVGSVEAPLAFDGDALFAGTEEGLVVRLDAERGSIAWRRRLAGAVRAAPVVTPDGLAVMTTSDTLYLLDPVTGEIRGRMHTPGSVLSAPALDGHRLLMGTTGGHLLEVQLPALTIAWDRAAGDAVYGSPALSGDTMYALARDGTLWIVPLTSPDAARSLKLDLVALAGPTPIASGLLVAGVNGEVLLVNRDNGSVVWRAHLDGPIEQPPLVRDRQLVVIAGRGDIHTYR